MFDRDCAGFEEGLKKSTMKNSGRQLFSLSGDVQAEKKKVNGKRNWPDCFCGDSPSENTNILGCYFHRWKPCSAVIVRVLKKGSKKTWSKIQVGRYFLFLLTFSHGRRRRTEKEIGQLFCGTSSVKNSTVVPYKPRLPKKSVRACGCGVWEKGSKRLGKKFREVAIFSFCGLHHVGRRRTEREIGEIFPDVAAES